MKRKSLLLTLLMAFFAPLAMMGQETLTVYDGTTTNMYVPVYGNWADAYLKCEFVVPASDLEDMDGGTISQMDFYLSSPAAEAWTGTFQVFLKEVEETSLSAWSGTDNATTVFTGNLDGTGSTMTVQFSDTYTYGGGNLLVGVYQTAKGNYKSCYFYGASVTGASGSNYNSSSLDGVSFSQRNFLPKTTFTYTAASVTCEKPESIEVTNVTAYEADVTWTGGSGVYNLQWKKSSEDWSDDDIISNLNSTSYNFTELESNTTYNVRVQSVCEGSTSGWKSTSFTTDNACAAPTNLQITDITTESATLTWTPGYQETTWTVKYKKSTETEYTTETVNSTPTLTLSNLASLTTYNVQVYNCENYVSGNFTTAAGIPLVEEFGTSLPTGWSQQSGLLADVLNGAALSSGTAWYFGNSNGVFDNHARTNVYGTGRKHWLIMPSVPMENNVQLSFEVAYTAYSGTAQAPAQTGTDDKFVVLVSTDNMATWTILRQWDNDGSEYVLNDLNVTPIPVNFDLSSYVGQNVIVAFYAESTESNADNNLHIDNVSIDYIPDCAKPTGLGTSDVTAHEATISWTSDAEAWQVMLNEDEENITDVEENTYTFTLLDAETAYTAKVRTNCNGIYSEWTNPVSFTTTIACPAPTTLAVTPYGLTATLTWQSNANAWEVAYASDADADPAEYIVGTVNEATYTANDLELGDYYFWVRANCGDLDGYSEWAGPVSVHIGYCLPAPTSVDNSGISNVTFGTGDYIVNNDTPKATYADYTEQIGAVQAGAEASIAITFKTGYTYDTYVWVDLDNSLSFEVDEVVCYGVSTNANPTTLTLNFIIPITQTLGDFRLRIGSADTGLGSDPAYANPCYTGSYGCFQDYTLRVLEAPSCLAPTDLAVNYTGGLTAEVTWVSEAETFNIDVNGEVTEGVTNPYTLEGLELATTYEVKVQANCGDNGVSEWTNAVSFATDLCMPENQCEITFELTDSYGDGWNGAYIEVLDVETGISLAQMSNNNIAKATETETYTLAVCDGREIQFVWHSGSYDSECSYIVTDIMGEEIFYGSGAMSEPVNYTVNCPPTFTKQILGYGNIDNPGGYYLIASPIGYVNPEHVGQMTGTPFDLYRFNQENEDEWENYKTECFDLEPGKGYLYANMEDVTLTFVGYPMQSDVIEPIPLQRTEGVDWAGWNLVGNPFADTAYILDINGETVSFYTLNAAGSKLEPVESFTSIAPMEGVFVYAEQEDEILNFTTEEPVKSSMLILNMNNENGYVDRVMIRFDQSRQLPKFMLNENDTKMYIPQDDDDFAVVRSNRDGKLPVSFEPSEDGVYSISVNSENVYVRFLHLIDHQVDVEVDLLQNPNYVFKAKTTDPADRFTLVFKTGYYKELLSSDSGSFCFCNNGNWMIDNEGDAILQVIDVNGQILSSEEISGCVSKHIEAAPGVYMLRLINGSDVKVQKVVVE